MRACGRAFPVREIGVDVTDILVTCPSACHLPRVWSASRHVGVFAIGSSATSTPQRLLREEVSRDRGVIGVMFNVHIFITIRRYS